MALILRYIPRMQFSIPLNLLYSTANKINNFYMKEYADVLNMVKSDYANIEIIASMSHKRDTLTS